MDRLSERLEMALRALRTLREVCGEAAPSSVVRDAAMQRFDYSLEAVWRASQRYLLEHEGIDASSPKAAIRAAREVGLLDDAQAERALGMADDRNLTVHTYNEPLADAIYARLAGHLEVLDAWLASMRG